MLSVHERVEAQADDTPDAVAVVCKDHHVTYRDVDRRANALARYLRGCGAGADDRVAICMEPSADLVVAALGIVKAGAAYVALDPAWPDARIGAVLRSSRPRVLVVSTERTSAALCFEGKTIALRDSVLAVCSDSTRTPAIATSPDQLFTIVYTSGSTGQPKGVLVPTRSVLNRLQWIWTNHPYPPDAASLLYRSCAAIGFTWDCFGPLAAGVPIVIAPVDEVRDPGEMARCVVERGVTHITASPGLWDAVLDHAERHPAAWDSLCLARSNGDQLRGAIVERWRRVFPAKTLLNMYGSTECSSTAALDVATVGATGADRVPVGTCLPNVDVHVVDEQRRPVSAAETGEICIAGACVARGYLDLPALTAERFVPNPFGEPGSRMFRSGDVGVWRHDGYLEVAGRRDHQVKIRGFRTEIAEVEAAVRRCAGVRASAVAAYEEAPGDTRLAAYVVMDDESLCTARGLRSELLDTLPPYMVPSRFVALPEMPLTSTGKIDRPALRDVLGDLIEFASEFVAPRTPDEHVLAEIWSDVLGVATIGIDDDFFELGGHSLLGMQIVSRVDDRFGVAIRLADVFDKPTVRQLLDAITRSTATDVNARCG